MYRTIVYLIVVLIIPFSYAIATTFDASIYPTPLVYMHTQSYCQRIIIQAEQEFEGQIIASVDGIVTKKSVGNKVKQTTIDCYRHAIDKPSRVDVTIKNNSGVLVKKSLTIPPVKKWKLYCVPFTHVDIGFTQSQKNVRMQNISNLQKELLLLEKTKNYTHNAQFKLFTEVSWPVMEFLHDQSVSEKEKQRLIQALQKGDFELGAFVISHQNRFMSPYALLASLQHTLRIAEKYSINVKTACIHDVMDFSKLPKILQANNIPYCVVGPNDSRYRVPPLFYLVSPDGSAKVLMWHSVGLNGYGENFDLNMRISLPFNTDEYTTMENSIAYHLAQLEKGYPTEEIKKYFDYNNMQWNYPYDAYLLPYYPSQGGDNQPQNIVPSEIAHTWNTKFINPEIIIATPKEFFDYVSQKYHSTIPVIKGELPPFWGEQIYLDFIQVDPERVSINYLYDYAYYMRGIDVVKSLLHRTPVDIETHIAQSLEGYMAIILNNDHNPRPVPFGKTHYTNQDVKDWMNTRNEWVYVPLHSIKESQSIQQDNPGKHQWTLMHTKTNPVILENAFYRIAFDTTKGCITSIFDKQLHKEWVNTQHRYGINQYVIGIRGENAAQRNYFDTIEGFKKVSCVLYTNANNDYRIIVEGSERSYYKGMELLSEFLHKAFGVKLPAPLLKIAYFFYQLFLPSLSLTQEIIIPSSKKQIDFIQHFEGKAPQISEHYFAYPIQANELLYDSAFTPIKWQSIDSDGDIIPAAKNSAPFRSINDTLYPFQWMHGIPTSFHCDTFVLHRDRCHYAVFIPHTSKAIVTAMDVKAGFYHCCIGWSLWGKLGMGRDLPVTIAFKSTFTSFDVCSQKEAIATAYRIGFDILGYTQPLSVEPRNSNVRVVYMQPVSVNKIVIGLYELSGKMQNTQLTVSTKRRVLKAYYSNVNGEKVKTIQTSGNSICLNVNPHELSFITIELL